MPKDIKGIGLVFGAEELADEFGVSKYTVMRDYRLGKLMGRKFGRQILFTADAVKAFLESGSPSRRTAVQIQAFQGPAKDAPTNRELQDMTERNRVIEAMKRARNHRREAARLLRCSEVTLRAKFKRFGLTFPSNRGRQG
jgi:transcriptional regulator with GAF, ATPase, and Fis domain